MKTVKKILMVLCILVIIVGMFILGRNGLNYQEGYTQNILLETAKQYTVFMAISTVIILVYFAIRYNKQGVVKVIVTSVLGILGAMAFVLALFAIIKMPITRIFFPIMLATYVSSIIVLTTSFEENTGIHKIKNP